MEGTRGKGKGNGLESEGKVKKNKFRIRKDFNRKNEKEARK